MAERPVEPPLEPSWDVVVVGGGAAGLMACLELPRDLRILLLSKERAPRSASRWAQGGIAAVTRPEDSFASHIEDTLKAGAGLCDPAAVALLVRQAPACVERLLQLGMAFDRNAHGLSTTLEAAHSHRRVLHAQDRTGGALVDALEREVLRRPGLERRLGSTALQLWMEGGRCCGLQMLDQGQVRWLAARAVVLATGGGGHLFANTTNPAQASGDGVAMAARAGALIRDLEFVQFHPTALMLPGAPHFLISEAVRGEGARLRDAAGASPVAQLAGGDLAPRDAVSRALVRRMREQQVDHLWLDLRPVGTDRLEKQFPTILGRCRELGLEPTTTPIPVAPAAHYWMGGIRPRPLGPRSCGRGQPGPAPHLLAGGGGGALPQRPGASPRKRAPPAGRTGERPRLGSLPPPRPWRAGPGPGPWRGDRFSRGPRPPAATECGRIALGGRPVPPGKPRRPLPTGCARPGPLLAMPQPPGTGPADPNRAHWQPGPQPKRRQPNQHRLGQSGRTPTRGPAQPQS